MKEYFTTGETTELLGISRSTVSRKFDKGILKGKKNPVTGDRLISGDSLMAFMKEYNLAFESEEVQRKVILVTSDNVLTSIVLDAIGEDRRFDLKILSRGADALIIFTREKMDLLIIDNDLPDIYGVEVIDALKRIQIHNGFRFLCCTTSVEKGKNHGSINGEYIDKQYLTPRILKQRVKQLLNITDELSDEPEAFKHVRLFKRYTVNLPCELKLISEIDHRKNKRGTAVLRDISFGGATLTSICLPEDTPFAEIFRFTVTTSKKPLENWEADSKLLRIHSDNPFHASVRFLNVSNQNLEKILKLSHKKLI